MALLLGCAVPLQAQSVPAPVPATFLQPIDGGTQDPGQAIRWTPQPGALAYYLYVGTGPGQKDLIDTGETQATQWSARSLPVAKTLYSRLYTKYGSGWVYTSITFSVTPLAAFISPSADGATIAPNQRFQWTAVENAEAYVLDIGSSPGLQDYLTTGEIHATTFDVAGLPAGRTVYARLSTRHGGVWRSTELTLNVAPTATFITPLDGDSNFSPGANLTWRAIEGAQAYYLYVGTAPGKKDIIDSGETQATSWPAKAIPVDRLVYARLYTKYGGSWRYVDISFRLTPQAAFTNPSVDGATINADGRFEWTTVPGVDAYFLYVGSAPGLNDIVNTGEIQATYYKGPGLPAGKTVYARLYTKYAGIWRHVDLTLNVAPIATFIAPVDGEQNLDPAADIRWRAVDNAQAYYLYVGTARGRKDLIDSGETQATSRPAKTLPAGVTLYARLYTKYGDAWRYTEITFQLAPQAIFIDPGAEGAEVDPRSPITWTSVASAQAYFLYVGSQPGMQDLISTGETSARSRDISSLPRGRMLYATLYTKVNGAWRYTRRSFSVKPVATLINRADAPSRIDTRYPLQWVPVDSAQAYYLYVGSTLGAKDLVNSGEVQATQFRIDGIPAGTVVYVRLFTKHGGAWRYVDSTYKTRSAAYLSGSVASSGVWQAGSAITWSPFAGATKYYVYVGTAPGKLDISSSGEFAGTQFIMPSRHAAAIQADRTLYVRLYSLVEGHWEYVDYTIAFQVASQLSFPANGATNVDVTSIPMVWNEVSGATAYRLQLGTTPGADDVFDSNDVTTLERRSGALPGGRTVYARLWTEINGERRYVDETFETRPAAAFTYPLHGQQTVDVSRQFEWSTVPGADGYRVELGTTPGSHDLYDSNVVTSQSVDVSGALLSASGVIYGRVWTHQSNTWRFSDAIFTVGTNAEPAAMTWSSSKDAFIAGEAFRWSAAPMAETYRLRLGTFPGGDDIHDSVEVRSTRRLIDGLPVGVPLYGTLRTNFIDGSNASTEFEVTISDAGIDQEDRWNLAMWATAEVRSMANAGNIPLPNSMLLDAARHQLVDAAFCSTYASAEVDLLNQSNLGLAARVLNVCLNPNHYDCHTLVEVLNPDTQRFQVLDPTFGMTARRVSDNDWATAMDIFEATRTGDFQAIEYVPLTAGGLSYANAYYLDYPLLFTNVYAIGNLNLVASVDTVMPYFDTLSTNIVSSPGYYAIRCAAGVSSVAIRVTGVGGGLIVESGIAVVPCEGPLDGLSHVFGASSIEPADGSGDYDIVVPRRFVF